MCAGLLLLLTVSTGAFETAQSLEQVLSRVSEEAEAFRLAAPNLLARERLVQRSLQPPKRFRPRLGNSALQPPKPQYRTREVISEYGFACFRQAPGALHEFRQVVSVDNHRVTSPEKARRTLTAGLRSEDDRLKKQMLEDFEKHGLSGAAADFGQVLLLFTRRRLADYTFNWISNGNIGATEARILNFRQTGGAASFAIFQGRQELHEPIHGQIWVRSTDFLPLRVVLDANHRQGSVLIHEEAAVDYITTPQGHLAPVSVTHRETAEGTLTIENVFQYSDFHAFEAKTEVQFSGEGKKQ